MPYHVSAVWKAGPVLKQNGVEKQAAELRDKALGQQGAGMVGVLAAPQGASLQDGDSSVLRKGCFLPVL